MKWIEPFFYDNVTVRRKKQNILAVGLIECIFFFFLLIWITPVVKYFFSSIQCMILSYRRMYRFGWLSHVIKHLRNSVYCRMLLYDYFIKKVLFCQTCNLIRWSEWEMIFFFKIIWRILTKCHALFFLMTVWLLKSNGSHENCDSSVYVVSLCFSINLCWHC